MWHQIYDPLGNPLLSTALAALPVVVLLAAIGIFRVKAHYAALLGLAAALIIAIFVFGMPYVMAGKTAVYGVLQGLLPIGWIILNVIFLYKLAESTGRFKILQDSIAGITNGRHPHRPRLLAARRVGAFADRQHRAGCLWRARYADHRPAERHGPGPEYAVGDGRAPAAILFDTGAVLADLGVCRLQAHARNLAGDPGHGGGVRRPAIPDVQLSRTDAR